MPGQAKTLDTDVQTLDALIRLVFARDSAHTREFAMFSMERLYLDLKSCLKCGEEPAATSIRAFQGSDFGPGICSGACGDFLYN